MNQKEYLFLELNSSSKIDVQMLLFECIEFKQVHFYLNNFEIDRLILDELLLSFRGQAFLYCFSEREYMYAIEHNITPHLCWLNEGMQKISWIDLLIAKNSQVVKGYELFWMLGDSFINSLDNDKEVKLARKIESYHLPICFNASRFFNPNNNDFSSIQFFIKKINSYFKNPLYLKELHNINHPEGNYYLQNNNSLKKIIMGFFGDIINEENNIDRINIKNMNTSKECLNCELYDNCTTNKIGYFMNNYNVIKCWGPKLMSLN